MRTKQGDRVRWLGLTFDQYPCHVEDYFALKHYQDNRVLCYSPHSHSSHYTQPLDVSIIKPVKSNYTDRKGKFVMEHCRKPNQWEMAGLSYQAIREVCDQPEQYGPGGSVAFGGGKGLIKGAFRRAGYYPFDKNFMVSQSHLTVMSAVTDDGMETVSPPPPSHTLSEGEEVILLNRGREPLARATWTSLRLLHGLELPDGEDVVSVTFVVGGHESPARLLYQDRYERHLTFGEAWEASGDKGFLTAHPHHLIVASTDFEGPVGGASKGPTKLQEKSGQREEVFGVAACTATNVRAISKHPRFDEACRRFVEELAGDDGGVSNDLPSDLAVTVVRHIVEKGGAFVADFQSCLPQIGSKRARSGKRRGRKSSRAIDDEANDEDVVGGGAEEADGHRESTATGPRSINFLGENKATPKILNPPSPGGGEGARLEAMREEREMKEEAEGAARAHLSKRAELIRPVVAALVTGGIVGPDEKLGDRPAMPYMKAYIEADHDRCLAFAQYKRRHGLTGNSTVQYQYYFDFIHGGGVAHKTVTEPENPPRALVVASYEELNKTVSSKGRTPFKPVLPQGPTVTM